MRRRTFSGAGWVLAAALTLALTGCGAPAGESPAPTASAPIPTPTETAGPAQTPPPGPLVYTDYSKLEAKDDAPRPTVYTRWYGEFTDHLIPLDDYGPLIPFSGAVVTCSADDLWGWMDDYYLCGLMTLDGKVVVDPVYGIITRLGWGGMFDFGIYNGYHPAYILGNYAGDGQGNLFSAHGDVRSALCALDGSWVTQEVYRFPYVTLCYGYVPRDGRLFALRDGNVLVMLDMDTGNETFAVTLEGYGEEALDHLLSYAFYADGLVATRVNYSSDDYLCWDLNGHPVPLPSGLKQSYDAGPDWSISDQSDGSQLLEWNGQSWVVPPVWDDLWDYSNIIGDTVILTYTGEFLPGDSRSRYALWRPETEEIPNLYDPDRVQIGNFYSTYIDPVTGEHYFAVGKYNDDGEVDAYQLCAPDGTVLFDNLSDFPILVGGRLLFNKYDYDSGRRSITLLSPEGEVLFHKTLIDTSD